MAESSEPGTATSTGAPRFPWAPLLVMGTGIGGVVAMRQVALETDMSAGVYGTGVPICVLVLSLGGTLYLPRMTRWQQARKEAGTTSWWDRLP